MDPGVEVEVEYDYDAELCDELSIRVGDVITQVKQMSGGWWEGRLNGKQGLFPENFVKVLKGKEKMLGDDDAKVALRKNQKTGDQDAPVKRCRVLFSYRPAHEDELELKLDDLVDFLDEVEDGWWRGRSQDGTVGVFPSNFVELMSKAEDKAGNNNMTADKNKKNENNDHGNRGNSLQGDILTVQNGKKDHQKITGGNIISKTGEPMSLPNIGKQKRSDTMNIAPKLPPKPVKEQCVVLFPYTALNEDELTLVEGQTITILSKDVEDKGWWKGEIDGKIGVFPDNFVKPMSATTVKEAKDAKAGDLSKPKATKPSVVKPGESKENSPSKIITESKRERKNSSGSTASEKSDKSETLKKPSQVASKINKLWSKTPASPPKSGPRSSDKPSAPNANPKKHSFGKTAAPPKPLKASSFSHKQKEAEPAKKTSLGAEPTAMIKASEDASGENLKHPTAARAKGPKRRPPSTAFIKEESGSIAEKSTDDSSWEEVDGNDVPAVMPEKKVDNQGSPGENQVGVLIRSLSGLAKEEREKPESKVQVDKAAVDKGEKPASSKPEWLQELSRKQATRNSENFSSLVRMRDVEEYTSMPNNSQMSSSTSRHLTDKPARPFSQPPPITAEKPIIPTKPSPVFEKPEVFNKPRVSETTKPEKPAFKEKPDTLSKIPVAKEPENQTKPGRQSPDVNNAKNLQHSEEKPFPSTKPFSNSTSKDKEAPRIEDAKEKEDNQGDGSPRRSASAPENRRPEANLAGSDNKIAELEDKISEICKRYDSQIQELRNELRQERELRLQLEKDVNQLKKRPAPFM